MTLGVNREIVMSVLSKFDAVIERMEKEEIGLQEYINSNSVKRVTDKDVKSGVDRLIYNHAVNKTQIVKICKTSMPTFNSHEKQLQENGVINEPFLQGQANMYNRFDLAALMKYFEVPKYSDYYNPIVIAVQNHKGGVGKSTTVRTISMATALDTELNAQVAILDLDPQGSCGFQGQPKDEDGVYLTIADIALRELQEGSPFFEYVYGFDAEPEDVVLAAAVNTHLPNLDIYTAFPDDERFTDFYHSLDDTKKNTLLCQLRDFIMPILKTKYDVIFIDTPPQDSPITWSVMLAADVLLTPIAPKELDYLSTRNFIKFTRTRIEQIGAQKNLKEWKVLPVNVDYSSRQQNRMIDRIRRTFTDTLTISSLESSELFIAADSLHRTIFDIQKTEARDNKYASVTAFNTAVNSSNAMYREIKSIIINTAIKG